MTASHPPLSTAGTTRRQQGRNKASLLTEVARRHPLVLVAAGVLLYSSGPVLAQASTLSGPQFSFWRLWCGVPVLAVVALVQMRVTARGIRRRGASWTVAAGLAFGTHQVLVFSAVKATSVADVMLVSTVAPILVGIAAVRLFGERPGAAFRLWSLLAMAGAAVVIASGASGPRGDPAGMTMAALNVVFFVVFFLISKKARNDIAVMPFLAGTMLVAALGVTIFVLLWGEATRLPGGSDLALVLAVALGPGTVGHFVMTWPLRWVRANVPPVMKLAQPFLGGLFAWYFLGETITLAHVIGGAATIAGACGAVLTPRGRRFAVTSRGPD